MMDLYEELLNTTRGKKAVTSPKSEVDLANFIFRAVKRKEYFLFFVTIVLSAVALYVCNYGTSVLFSDVILSGSYELFGITTFLVIGVYVAYSLLSLGKMLLVNKVSDRLMASVAEYAERRIIDLRYRHSSGLTRFSAQFAKNTIEGYACVIAGSLIALAQLIYIYFISVNWGLVMTAAVIVYIVSFIAIKRYYAFKAQDFAINISKESEFNRKVFNGYETLAPFKKSIAEQHARLYSSHAGKTLNPPIIVKMRNVFFGAIAIIFGVIAIGMSAKMSIGAVVSCLFSFAVLTAVALRVGIVLVPFALNKAYAKALLPLFVEEKQGITVNGTDLFLDRVSFSYNNKKIFDNLTMSIGEGEKVAIYGSSGSGKTTLFELINAGLSPNSGAVCLAGADVRALDKDFLVKTIGTLDADDKLLSGSVADNVNLGGNKDMLITEKALATVGLNNMVEALPWGVNTRLTCGGVNLADSEKLKMLFARSIANPSPIFAVDGVLDGVDKKTQKRFVEMMLNMPSTVILFTAREDLANKFPNVFRLNDSIV